MVRDTRPSQNASSHQIWNYYLKEYRRYAPNTKRDGRTDSAITICLPKFLWGHKNNTEITKMVNKRSTALERSVKIFYGGLKPVSRRVNLTLSSDVDQDIIEVAKDNVQSKAVGSLFIVVPITCDGSVIGPCFVMQCLLQPFSW